MSKKYQFAILLLVVAVSIIFGMVINSTISRVPKASAETPLFSVLPEGATVQSPNFADIAERANPAVLSIDVAVKVKRYHTEDSFPFGDFFRYFGFPERDEDGRKNRKSPEQEYDERPGGGSGFIISSDGYLLTNNHVVENATKIVVTLQNDDKYDAKIVGTDPQFDVALLKIDPKSSLAVLPLGDSDKLRVGEWVIAIGNPLTLEHTVTVGVVSAKSRRGYDIPLASFIQTDAAINFGNSGGPLLNAKGEVVGINAAIQRQMLAEGIGFAIPINPVKKILDQLKEKGKVSHGYLGVGVKPVSEKIKDYYKLPVSKGAFVDTVQTDLPGDKAGIKVGDIIVSVDDREIKDSSELVEEISSRAAGERVELGIYRNGKKMKLDVKLGDRTEAETGVTGEAPEKEEESISYEKFGFDVSNIPREYRYSLRDVQGVIVIDVKRMSDAWDEGIREEDIVTEVNSVSVRNISEFNREIRKVEKGEVAKFQILRREGTSAVFVRAAK